MATDTTALRAYLEAAPEELRGWADAQLAQLDREPDAVGIEEFADFRDDEPPLRPHVPPNGGGGRGRVNLVLVALLVAAVVIIVQQMGRPATTGDIATGGATTTSMPSALAEYPALDETRAAELKEQVAADPDDVAALRDLGKLYFDSGLYQEAIVHFTHALELAPDDVELLLSMGVAEYSLNNYAVAEQHWLRATVIDPGLAEPWYNLGFLYMAQTPPDYDGVRMAWGKVVEVAPGSELAKTVEAHLAQFESSASPSPDGP